MTDSGAELMLANWLAEEACLPCDNSTRRVIADCIRLLAKEMHADVKWAAEYILEQAQLAKLCGENVTRFWFSDQKYKPHLTPRQAGAGNQPAREMTEEEQHRMWLSMSEAYRAVNPWGGEYGNTTADSQAEHQR